MDTPSLVLHPWSLQICFQSPALFTVQQLHCLLTCQLVVLLPHPALPFCSKQHQSPHLLVLLQCLRCSQTVSLCLHRSHPGPSSCPSTRNPHDTALSSAASALFAHLSAVAPVLAPVETVLEDEPALRRQTELPVEEDMEIAGSALPGKHGSSPAPLPYMRHKLRAQLAFLEIT